MGQIEAKTETGVNGVEMGEAPVSIDSKAAAYLDELAADIVAHGGFGDQDPVAAMAAAHARRQAFIVEMANGETERSQIARKVLCAEVYGAAVLSVVRRKAIRQCEEIQRGSMLSLAHAALAKSQGGAQ